METITNASTNLRLTTHMDVFEDCDGAIIAPPAGHIEIPEYEDPETWQPQ